MLFRNELKELTVSLYLTRELEMELDKRSIVGASLSDKIKSFDRYEMPNKSAYIRNNNNDDDDFNYEDHNDYAIDNGYLYRVYKRCLLGGRYNNLRWVAHERNQLMHQDNYFILEYWKFKRTLKSGLAYFRNGMTSKFNPVMLVTTKERFYSIIPLVAAIFVSYETPLRLLNLYNEMMFFHPSLLVDLFLYFLRFLFYVIIFQIFLDVLDVLDALVNIFLRFIKITDIARIFLTKNKILLIWFSLVFFLWDKKLEEITRLF